MGEARAEIEAALAALPVDLREALVLVEVFGLPYAEVAAVVGVPVGTVKSRCSGPASACRPGPGPERRPPVGCDAARLAVSLRADGELDDDPASARLDDHLAGCPDCRRFGPASAAPATRCGSSRWTRRRTSPPR